MTNREAYKDILDNILGDVVAVVEGKPVLCAETSCCRCLFLVNCGKPGHKEEIIDWLNAEYQEPGIDWSKVPIDTPDGENMMKKINVVLEACIQTGEYTYTNVFKTVPIEVPDDGIDWHVAGEEKTNQRTS